MATRSRRPQSASRKVGYSPGSVRRPLPERNLGASELERGDAQTHVVPEAGRYPPGPGVVRDFPADSKFTWEHCEKEHAFTMHPDRPNSSSSSGAAAFRTVDISRLNEKRHNWTKADTFQTPHGHVADMEDMGDSSPAPCNFHSKWLGVLYKEIMNGVSRLLTAELVEMREDLHREFDSVKEQAAEAERSLCDYVDKVISGRAKELKYDVEGVGSRLDSCMQESATKMLECVTDLSREALRHHSQVDSTLQHLRSTSTDMGISIAKELGGVARSVEGSKEESRASLSEVKAAISSLPQRGAAPDGSSMVAQLKQELASMQRSIEETATKVHVQGFESKLLEVLQECKQTKSGLSDGVERILGASTKGSLELLAATKQNSKDILAVNSLVETSAACLQKIHAEQLPEVKECAMRDSSRHIEADPAAASAKEKTDKAQEELLAIVRDLREDMQLVEVKDSLACIASSLLSSVEASAAAAAAPPDQKQAEMLKLVREVHSNYMQLTEVPSNLVQLRSQVERVGELCKTGPDDIKSCVLEESKRQQTELVKSVEAIQNTRHDLDPLWVTIRTSSEQIGMVLTGKFDKLHAQLDQDRSTLETAMQDVKNDVLETLGAQPGQTLLQAMELLHGSEVQ